MMCIKHGLNILKMRVSTLLVFSVEPELSPGVSFSKAGGGWGGEQMKCVDRQCCPHLQIRKLRTCLGVCHTHG